MDPDLFPSEPDYGVPVYDIPEGVDPHLELVPGTSIEMLMRPAPTAVTIQAVLGVTMLQNLGDVPEVVPAHVSVPAGDADDPEAAASQGVVVNADSVQQLGYPLPPCAPVFIPGVFQSQLSEPGMDLWMDAPVGTVFYATDGTGPLARVLEETDTGQHPVWVALHGAENLEAQELSDLLYARRGDLTGMLG